MMRRRAGAPQRAHPPHERHRPRFRRSASAPRTPPVVVEQTAPVTTRRRDRVFRACLAVADVCAAALAVLAANLAFGPRGPGSAALVLVLIVPVAFTAMGLYRRDELVLSTNTLDEAPGIVQASTLSALAAYLLESALVLQPLGAKQVAVTMIALPVAAILLRVWAREAARRMTPAERCLVVGGPDVAERLDRKLGTGPAVKAELVGRVELESDESVARLPQRVAENEVHRVVIAGEGAPPERVHHAIQSAKSLGVKVSVLPRMFEVVGSSVEFDYLGGMTLLGVERFGLDLRQRAIKRAFDVAGSLMLILLLSPVLLAIALAIRLTSAGPGAVPPDAHRARGRGVRAAQVPLDGPRRRGAQGRAGRPQRGRRAVQDRRRPARDRRGAPAAPHLAGRAAAAVQRAARRDVAGRPAAADRRGGPPDPGLLPAPAAPHAGHDRALAGARLGARAPARDGVDRLPLRRQLVAVGRREDPAAHRAERAAAAGAITPAATGPATT